ncbi:hypothetical protein F5X99DRAFT_423231 [Biscogniauxia marginata]|nr:hypothetical protein F5X99DRAFT_423231 [Biscogniauxia marginata]
MGNPEADSGKGESNEQQQQQPPPPPYTPSGYTPPRPQQPQQHAVVRRQFPPSFSMYKASWGQRHYVIGERQERPLYAVSLHSGWSGQPDVVLHGGPSESAPPLAAAEGAPFGRSATITLPPLPPHGSSSSSNDSNNNNNNNNNRATEIRLESSGSGLGFGPGALTFTVETGDGPGNARREAFEWRHSRAGEVAALGGRSSGWKLVRLATDAGTATAGAGAGAGSAKSSTDGREVVAVWAWPSMSLSKALKFRFLGAGATGALGERWAVAAVITALRIWDRERRARNSGAGAGGAAGGTAGV